MDRRVRLGLVIALVAWGIALHGAFAGWRAGREKVRWERAPAWTGAVEVSGAVARPGVRAGLAGLTVREAIARAGPRTRPRGPQLERVLEEGERVELRGDGEVRLGRIPGRALMVLGLRIPLARASVEDLEALPGVGPVTAGRIVAFRDARGPVRNAGDLDAVPGIGPKTVERIRPHLDFGRHANARVPAGATR